MSGTFLAPPSGSDHWYIVALLFGSVLLGAKQAYKLSLRTKAISANRLLGRRATYPMKLTAVTGPI